MGAEHGPVVFILSVIGAVMVIEGLPYFGFPRAAKRWAAMLLLLPERRLRIMGLFMIAAGLLLLYAIRSL